MTHHVNSFWPIGHDILNFVTHNFWNSSEIFIDFNFGLIKVQKDHNDVIVTMQVKTLDDRIALKKSFSVKNDLTFNNNLLRNPLMCETVH